MLVEICRMARERGYGRVEWAVLKWNQPSIEFYEALGAVALEEWQTYRLAGEALERVAGPHPV
jgi:RimJ/RimL family protein N-acetyltransferase